MSFFFKKKSTPPSGLPQATRNLRSADGALQQPMSSLSAMSGQPPPRPDFRVLSPANAGGLGQNGVLRETVSEKTSMDRGASRLQNETDGADKLTKTLSADQKPARERSESEPRAVPPSRIAQPSQTSQPAQAPAPVQNPQAQQQPPRPTADPSPYPWSQRQLTYNVPNAYPFPRYGAAVNAVASRDGVLYIMGGLINGSTVKGDLWTIEAGTSQLACFPVLTTAEGPGPRVGHSSLLVGNAFIVFGGDTKTEESDLLDDTLYLLNTSTKQWSRAAPAGPRPPGRYGHTLNILGSKIYIFGGQVEGFFFNDLVAFDLNALQQASNKWEVLIQNTMDGGPPPGQAPPARTNHSMVTWNDRLYLFGGTDGVTWFNDVWSYEGRTNTWSQLECIGYIPTAREGHAAALVGDVMYIFGGRTEDGIDLGDLAAFKITSRRWYTFQNMGPSPSPRSGHSMTTIGKTIVVLAGEPSSAPRDAGELSLAYFLDTTKIRYPVDNSSQQTTPSKDAAAPKKANEKSAIPQSRNATPRQLEQGPPRQVADASGPLLQNGETGVPVSRLPRSTGPQPAQASGSMSPPPTNPYNRQPAVQERQASPSVADEVRNFPQLRSVVDVASGKSRANTATPEERLTRTESPALRSQTPQHIVKASTESAEHTPARASSRQKRYPMDQETPRPSLDRATPNGRRTASREQFDRDNPLVDSGVGSSPALTQQHDSIMKQLEAEKSKNAWYVSELALARKAGYVPTRSDNAVDDARSSSVGDEDRPLIEALLKMRSELQRMQQNMESKAQSTAEKIAQVEKQRDAAVNEATFAKARYAAQAGNNAHENYDTYGDNDRSNDLNKRLAVSLAAQTELNKRIDSLTRERDSERRARQVAEDGVDTHHKRIADLDSERQRTGGELETLRAELHEAQRHAREESAKAAQAVAAHQLLSVDHSEVSTKLESALAQSSGHNSIMASLHEAVTASTDKSALLETKLEEERAARNQLETKLQQLKAQHEERTSELETTSRQLRDAEELADKHANEAKTHRSAVLEGFAKLKAASEGTRGISDNRVLVLQEQVEAANAMVRANQAAADAASDKLRRAEERIAGLEAYQEQTSREGLSIRKQMQAAVKEMRSLGEEKARLQQQLQSQQLETNAINVQHSALKDVLSERGISATDLRKTRLADSPSSLNRHSTATPETPRLRDLQDQLEASHRMQEELRTRLDDVEDRDATTRKEYEDKLTALDSDHQAAAKYLRSTEKMLSKLKSELQRVKQQSAEYLDELETHRSRSGPNGASSSAAPADWEVERAQLQRDIAEAKSGLTASLTPLEAKISALQNDLRARDTDIQTLRSGHATTQSDLQTLRTTHDTSRADLERLQRENAALEERARDAEGKVQMLLDQVETSVDNYRRQTADLTGLLNSGALQVNTGNAAHNREVSNASSSTAPNGTFDHVAGGQGGFTHTRESSLGGHESLYSTATSTSFASGDTETDSGDGHIVGAFPRSRENSATRPPPLNTSGVAQNAGSAATTNNNNLAPLNARERNSKALNSLADELDGLRYRLSGRFDFEPLRTPTAITGGFHNPSGSSASAGGLAEWRRGLEKNGDDDEEGGFYPGRLTAMRSGGNLRGAAGASASAATSPTAAESAEPKGIAS